MSNENYDYAEYYQTELIIHCNPILAKIEADMQDSDRSDNLTPMIVGIEVGKTLYWLATITHAKRALEIGTGLGYATIWIAQALSAFDGQLITIERNFDIAEEARRNLQNAGLLQYVESKIGNAKEILPKLSGKFTYIFMDIWKPYYVEFLQPCVDILEEGGILIVARACWDSVKEYMEQAYIHPQLNTIVLRGENQQSPKHEGLIVSLKK